MNEEHQDQPIADKRARLRAPLMIKKIRLDDGEKVFFGYSSNISCSGLFISTINPALPGSRFHIEIPLPPPISRDIRCQCEAIWKRSYSPKSPHEPGMGLNFIDLSEDDRKALDAWITTLQEDAADA